jgi:twitching motility two-component system response regulator PilH
VSPFSSYHYARLLDDVQDLATRSERHARQLQSLVERQEYSALQELSVCAREQWELANRLLTEFTNGADTGHTPARSPAHVQTVLVVDDYDDTRELIATVLRTAGFIVQTACNGLEAINAAHEFHPLVIIMDITMPVLDGVEATRLIKTMDATCCAHVVAHSSRDIQNPAVLPLFAAVLPKPATPALLVATVQRLMN